MNQLDIYGNEDDTMSLDGAMNEGLDALTDAEKSALASALGIDIDAVATNIQGDMRDWYTTLDTPSDASSPAYEGDTNGN